MLKKIWEPHHGHVLSIYNEVCYKGTALYFVFFVGKNCLNVNNGTCQIDWASGISPNNIGISHEYVYWLLFLLCYFLSFLLPIKSLYLRRIYADLLIKEFHVSLRTIYHQSHLRGYVLHMIRLLMAYYSSIAAGYYVSCSKFIEPVLYCI